MSKANAVEVLPAASSPAPVNSAPMSMLEHAVQSGASIDVLTKLMELQERHERNQARRAFDEAISLAKADIAPISKNAKGHNDKRYANFAAYATAVDPIIAKHGLSYRFRTTQTDRINVTCILSHRAGHSEENTLSGPPDQTGNKNAIQAIGSTLTYLSRYSLVQALGLAATDDDDGKGAGDQVGAISDDQAQKLRILAEDVGADLAAFCKYMKIEAIPDLPANQYERAVVALEKKRAPK